MGEAALLRLLLLLATQAPLSTSRPLCHVSFAPQHSYSSLDLRADGIRVNTHDAWYINGDGGPSIASVAAFVAQSREQSRQRLIHYVRNSTGAGIVGGFNTTNLLILDIEGCADGASVALKYLGEWLRAERATNGTNSTFSDVVAAYRQRLAVARELFPHAQLALYGSPAQPNSFKGMDWALASEGYIEACNVHGLLDDASYALAVNYFGENATSAHHESGVFGQANTTLALAVQLHRSDGSTVPIIANTKFTYRGGPLVSPFAGWVEPATTEALFRLWGQEQRVARVVYWYYSDGSLQRYQQPNLTQQHHWWLANKDAIAPGCP